MRVLQLHNHHRGPGGAMEVLQHESRLLMGGGHQVRQLTLPSVDELGLPPYRQGLKAIWNVEFCRELEGEVRAFRPDVVHVHTPFPLMSPAVFRVARRLGVPTVTTLHSYRYSCIAAICYRDGHECVDCVGKVLKSPGVRHRCYHDSLAGSAALTVSLALHRGLGTFHRDVGRFVALTDFSRRLLIRDGIPAEKVVVKPNSVLDPGVRRPDPAAQRYVAFAGRLVEIKGVRTMLDAWQRADRGDLQLRIAGDGESRDLVGERAAADPSIHWEGWISEADIFDLMGHAETVLVPSQWYEGGVPLVAMRSLAVGTPVVVSDLENISATVLADDAGVGFRVGNADSLAAVIDSVAGDPGSWRERRRKARLSYEQHYSPTVDLPRLEKVYTELLAGA
ncbi:MAG: glycosyltransferase family 4 protein [Actinomycetota bacterium]|nr:glycosyltransferase family 4 protein [Actinomycetota bacterium]